MSSRNIARRRSFVQQAELPTALAEAPGEAAPNEHRRSMPRSSRRRGETFPVQSTRHQITRYARWWTNEHGFYPGGDDLSRDAQALLQMLPEC